GNLTVQRAPGVDSTLNLPPSRCVSALTNPRPDKRLFWVLQIEAEPLVLHTELVESRAPAQADCDGDLPMLVAAVFCCIHQQFIDDQRQRHGCLFGKIPPGRFAIDRYVAAEQSTGIGADSA